VVEKKTKKKEINDRRLTLCHEKVEGQKTQSKATPGENVRGDTSPSHPGFCYH